MQPDKSETLSDDQLLECFRITRTVCTLILLDFARGPRDLKAIIIRNFIARSNQLLESISQLWSIRAFQDCWSLYRCILDRLFHLVDLSERNNFEDFEKWCFIKQYEQLNTLASDTKFADKLSDELLAHKKRMAGRYNDLKKEDVSYKRPDARSTAKKMDTLFLFQHGYDYASMHIHPMANDGEEAFLNQIGDHNHGRHMDHRSVLRNSLVAHLLLLQHGMKATDCKWVAPIARFPVDVLDFLKSGSTHYQKTFLDLSALGPGTPLSDRAV